MITIASFIDYTTKYSLIPLDIAIGKFEELELNLEKLSSNYSYTMLLESGEYGTDNGRFTFFANSPFLNLVYAKNKMSIEGDVKEVKYLKSKGIVNEHNEQPIKILNNLFEHYRSPNIAELPYFTGGAIGYLGYEFIKQIEKIKNDRQLPSPFAEIHLAFVKEVLVYDHTTKILRLIYNADTRDLNTNLEKVNLYNSIKKYLHEKKQYWRKVIKKRAPESMNINELRHKEKQFNQPFSKDEYIKAVETIKQKIIEGEVFQTVLSQKLVTETNINPSIAYKVLRQLNPSPYMFYLQMDNETLIGTSPETLVKVSKKNISTFPIAGTRPLGKTQQEQKKLEEDLFNDPKEIAEHIMLIDLARNDLGKVSKPGTVRVEKKLKIERYSHVMHLVSKVTGELRNGNKSLDVLNAVFPAGTVSGAPKVRAMELIAELEPEQRGPYAGAIIAFGFNGNLDSCITIRSIFFKHGLAHIQSGAGIVAESNPEAEYMEAINKAKVMLKAIQLAESIIPGGRGNGK